VSAVGWLIAAAGVVLLYLSLKPRPASIQTLADKLGGSTGATGDLNPSAPAIVGIPKTILPTGYADCLVGGGKWNFNGGDCVMPG
jgi:hypothetical protein